VVSDAIFLIGREQDLAGDAPMAFNTAMTFRMQMPLSPFSCRKFFATLYLEKRLTGANAQKSHNVPILQKL
jgi:hypothetical protein